MSNKHIVYRIIQSCENPNTKYHETRDGLRLIFRDGVYDGWYAELTEAVS